MQNFYLTMWRLPTFIKCVCVCLGVRILFVRCVPVLAEGPEHIVATQADSDLSLIGVYLILWVRSCPRAHVCECQSNETLTQPWSLFLSVGQGCVHFTNPHFNLGQQASMSPLIQYLCKTRAEHSTRHKSVLVQL